MTTKKPTKRKTAAERDVTDAEITRIQAMAHAAECGVFEAPKLDKEIVARAAKVAYQRFVKEAGYQKDARIKEWDKLSYVHQDRWKAITVSVIETFLGKGV